MVDAGARAEVRVGDPAGVRADTLDDGQHAASDRATVVRADSLAPPHVGLMK